MKYSLCLRYKGRGYHEACIQPSVCEILGPHVPVDPLRVDRVGRRSYLRGETYEVRNEIKIMGFHWDVQKRAWWIGSDEKTQEARRLLLPLLAHRRDQEKFDKHYLVPHTDFSQAN